MDKRVRTRLADIREVIGAESGAIDEVRGSEFFEPEYYSMQHYENYLQDNDSYPISRMNGFDRLGFVDWREVARNTHPLPPLHEAIKDLLEIFYGMTSIQGMIRKALRGDPIAQYRMAEICAEHAPQYEGNGRRALMKASAMFLLVSGREGNVHESREAILQYLHEYPNVNLRDRCSVEKYVNDIIEAHTNWD